MLLIALYPRQLGPRFVFALVIGLGLPFLAQSPEFVWSEYRQWATIMIGDDRFYESGTSYRDLSQILQLAHVPINRAGFLVLQIVLGVMAALTCLLVQWRRGWEAQRLVRLTYFLGTFWMILCGPATESSTYVLLAPVAAWLTMSALRGEFPAVAKGLIVFGFACVHLALASSAFPFGGRVHDLGLHPLGALAMLLGYLHAEFGNRSSARNRVVGSLPLQPALAPRHGA
jgi:hypothetical protein